MKKKIIKILAIFIVLACVITPLFFLFPEKPTITKLDKPATCSLTVLNDGKVQLSTEKNEDASGYIFAICDSNANLDDPNYFVKIESETNTVDATNYFSGNKTYYYYAYYKGTGNFSNSEKTTTNKYLNTIQLNAPSNFSRENTTLGWDAVSGATSYTIYKSNEVLATQTTRTYDFSSLLAENQALYFQVRANGDALHISSPKSNTVSYVSHVQLATPTNLTISGTGLGLKLSWNAVNKASTYTVRINEKQEVIVSNNSLSLATYLTELGPYSFKVKTNDNGNYLGSVYSAESETHTKYETLSAPTGLNAVKNSQFIEISWNAVQNVNSYTLKINGVEYNNISSTRYSINSTIVLPKENLIYEIQVKANAVGYYLSSNYSSTYTYSGFTQFSTPTNFVVAKTNNNIVASWTAVANANSYTILLDESKTFTAYTNSFELTSYCTEPKSYFLQIKANANIEQMCLASVYSSAYEYKNMFELSSPTNLTATSDGENLIFAFSAPANSLKFTVLANNTVITEELTTLNNKVALSSLPTSANGLYTFAIFANENGYFSASKTESSAQYTLLSSPTNLFAERTEEMLCIYWDAMQNATAYEIYVNDELIETNKINFVEETQVEILLTNITTASTYNVKVIATSSNANYLTSIAQTKENVKLIEKRATPTGLNITKNGTSYVANWNGVGGALGYNLALNNNIYVSPTNQLVLDSYISLDEIYSVRVCALASEVKNNSDYCPMVMLNTSSTVIDGFSNRYFYYHGWNDFVIKNSTELNALIGYFIYEMPSEINFYSNYDSSVSNSEKFNKAFENAVETRSIKYSIQNFTSSKTVKISSITYNYVQGGENTTLKTTTTQMENAGYLKDTKLAPHLISTQTRANDFNDFASEKSLVEVSVKTSNQLFKAIEGGAKPIIASTNTHLLNIYETAKQVLRQIISDDMSEYEKAHAIFDWIISNCYYDYLTLNNVVLNQGSYNCYYLEGVFLDRVAVCDGFSKSYSMLCSMEGIKCIKINGNANGGEHAWNKIYLNVDGEYKWYAVDITWSNAYVSSEQTEYLTHSYFLLNDTQINSDHSAVGKNPSANGTINYYDLTLYNETNSLNIKSTTQLQTLVDYMLKNKQTLINPNGVQGFEFKYFDTANYKTDLSTAMRNRASYKHFLYNGVVIVIFQ